MSEGSSLSALLRLRHGLIDAKVPSGRDLGFNYFWRWWGGARAKNEEKKKNRCCCSRTVGHWIFSAHCGQLRSHLETKGALPTVFRLATLLQMLKALLEKNGTIFRPSIFRPPDVLPGGACFFVWFPVVFCPGEQVDR